MPADFLATLSVDARQMAWQSLLESNVDDRSPAWIAERGGRPIGYVVAGPPRDEDLSTRAAEIYAIYVYPEDWRTGAGRALLNAATAELAARGAETLVLWVLEGNAPARAFYETMGWNPDGGRQELDMGGFKTFEVRYRRSRK
jgi:GNAT superfamily N-acetyltransferase